jgi:hypothetical protein
VQLEEDKERESARACTGEVGMNQCNGDEMRSRDDPRDLGVSSLVECPVEMELKVEK